MEAEAGEEEEPSQRRNARIGKAKAQAGFGVNEEKPLPTVEPFVFFLSFFVYFIFQKNLASPTMEWAEGDDGRRKKGKGTAHSSSFTLLHMFIDFISLYIFIDFILLFIFIDFILLLFFFFLISLNL